MYGELHMQVERDILILENPGVVGYPLPDGSLRTEEQATLEHAAMKLAAEHAAMQLVSGNGDRVHNVLSA